MQNNLISFCLILILLKIDSSCSEDDNELVKPKPKPTPYQDWDYLLFTQRWPITTCEDWQERNSNNKCNLPADRTAWTVHGIWPTKYGTTGPLFCDSAIHFDINQLIPMENDLINHWTNVEGNTKPYSFWNHEWNKHGTCASILPQFNSVTNYFRKGLQWQQQFQLSTILANSQIIPKSTNGYVVEDIFNAIKSFTKTNPMIECVIDSVTKESLISEIRICFNKSLDLIDCDSNKPNKSQIYTNCNQKKPVLYLAQVPSFDDDYDQDINNYDLRLEDCKENYKYVESLYNFYQLLRFLIWFTL